MSTVSALAVRVLMVDNVKVWADALRKDFDGINLDDKEVHVKHVTSLAMARRALGDALSAGKGFDAIIVSDMAFSTNTSVPDEVLDFIVEAKASFSGPIIAATSDCNYARQMMGKGCRESSLKSRLAEKLRMLFGKRSRIVGC